MPPQPTSRRSILILSSHLRCVYTVHTAHDAAPQDHSQPQPTHPGRTPHAVGYGIILLMMGLMMPETYWDRTFDNKHLISCILLVLSLHLMFAMHGHNILKLYTALWRWPLHFPRGHSRPMCLWSRVSCLQSLSHEATTSLLPPGFSVDRMIS